MRSRILTCLCALALAGCASPQAKFSTNRDPLYRGKLGKVLVVYYKLDTASTLGRDFSGRLAARVNTLLAQKSVPSETVRLEQEMLDRDAPLRAAAARFRPTQLLFFAITRVDTSSGSHRALPGEVPQFHSELAVSLEFNLTDAATGRTVWRGETRYYSAPRAEDVAGQVVDQIVAAQFLQLKAPEPLRWQLGPFSALPRS